MREPAALLLCALCSCSAAPAPAALARVVLAPPASQPQAIPLPEYELDPGARCSLYGPSGTPCLRWSGPQGRITAPLPHAEGAQPLLEMTVWLPNVLTTSCPFFEPCGQMTAAVDAAQRAMSVQLQGDLKVRYHQCRTRYCVRFTEGDSDRAYTPCEGDACFAKECFFGPCPDEVPCQGTIIKNGTLGCPNPDIIDARLLIEASAQLREDDLAGLKVRSPLIGQR